MVFDLMGILSLAAAAVLLVAAAVVLVPLLTSRSNELRNPADIES